MRCKAGRFFFSSTERPDHHAATQPQMFHLQTQIKEVKMKTLRMLRMSFLVLITIGPKARALETTPVLTLDVARQMIAGCETKAQAEGWKMNVSVVDVGANPLAFERMDGAFLGGVEISRLKAETAAKFPFPTRRMQDVVYGQDGKPGPIPGMATVPGLAAVPGGLAVMTATGKKVGAIGASGGLPDQDEACAQAGLDSVKSALQ